MTQPAFRLPLVDQYLEEQRHLTAVERFAQRHDANELPAGKAAYEELIPLSRPGPGQQYAFSVDLDACTGCKACVTACHRLNGLDEQETWRSVGLLHGGSEMEPVVQTVTTACHHCVEPACMNGCPVMAYEKDPETGIVKHLDDQCIGCQYCTFTCPYEVPKFNMARGIVRKCDMCSDRLAEGEAPACVQACPNSAISIRVVAQDDLRRDAAKGAFLPGTPSPRITKPSTRYVSKKKRPENLVPADYYQSRPAHEHWPLVIMLVLTQLSVGAYVTELFLASLGTAELHVVRPYQALVALALGLVALGASTLHLGRPLYAFRALMGIRTSWMSREILAFGAFSGLAALYAASLWTDALPAVESLLPAALLAPARDTLALAVALAGLVAVLCSAMLYHVTRRTWWALPRTGFRFFGSAALLGLSTTLTTRIVLAGAFATAHPGLAASPRALVVAVMLATVVKVAGELAVLRHRSGGDPDLRRTGVLLTGALRDVTRQRVAAGVFGGLLLPALLLLIGAQNTTSATLSVVAVLSFGVLVAGEILERRLFFSAASPPRMPGGVGA